MNNSRKELWLFRREESSGGAEIAAKRLVQQFETLDYEVVRVKAGDEVANIAIKGNRGPGWVRLLQFAISSNQLISQSPDHLSFSLERGVKADIYRAGEGVHLAWLKRKGILKSLLSFRPLHPVAILLESATMKAAKYIVANSEMIAEELRQHYPQHASKIRVIENGFDPSRFFVANSKTPNPDIATESHRLVFAGNGWDRKGLARAMKLLSLLPSPWRLEILGKGDQARFETMARDLEIHDRVNFRGPVEDIESYYRESEALVLPTTYDPFSNACLEAAACGCPVITTADNGFSTLIDHCGTGFILSKGADSLESCAHWCTRYLPVNRDEIAKSVATHTIADETRKYLEIFDTVEKQKRESSQPNFTSAPRS
jgi:UDP-glucose:(heptosyl)LPS alpha-1,3-glucosyltransferase